LLVFWPTLHGETKSRIEKQFTSRGIDVDRIELRHEPDERGYLGVYDDIDIGLDVFPWTGGTTTREALWMGVVVMALYGDRRTARGTAAVMDHVGLQGLIADSHDRYVELAIQLAGDLDKLEQLRAGMRDRMRDTICNAARFTGELEDAYRAMWVEWCRTAATDEETSE
jgi:predicted O-linked N-acetylglucosamine transferase (SPINDLY family)